MESTSQTKILHRMKVGHMEIWVHLLLSIFSYLSLVVLTFSLFKIPIIEHHRIITMLSLLLGSLVYYLRFVVESNLFGLISFAFFVVLLMLLKRYPILYCLITCGIGFLIVNLVDITISISALQFRLIEDEFTNMSFRNWTTLNIAASSVVLIIAWLLRSWNIGFSFVIRRFSNKQILKSHNFIWAAIIILFVTIAQLNYFVIDSESLHLYIFLVVAIGLFAALIVAYFQNKKSLRDRFGR